MDAERADALRRLRACWDQLDRCLGALAQQVRDVEREAIARRVLDELEWTIAGLAEAAQTACVLARQRRRKHETSTLRGGVRRHPRAALRDARTGANGEQSDDGGVRREPGS